MPDIVFGSVCSGIEAASVAWKPFGWRCAFMSEIAKFPRAVFQHHYPDIPLRGDFTEIQAGDHESIDVLVGGTPCQSFSVAGLRGGLADERGNLALEYLRLADRLRPRWVVWENVPGVLSSFGGRDFGSFVGALVKLGYGVAYRSLDAQYFHLAQRRKRVFVVGHLGDWRRSAAVLFDRASLRGDSAPRRETRACVADLTSTGVGTCGADDNQAQAGHLIADVAGFGGNNTRGPIDVATAVNAHGGPCGRMDFESETFIAHALRGEGFDASEDGTGRGMPIGPVSFHENQLSEISVSDTAGALSCGGGKPGQGYPAVYAASGVRRLTPRECERLQGFPDDYTLVPWRKAMASDGPRYAAIGNSMPVPVMAWIGCGIAGQMPDA